MGIPGIIHEYAGKKMGNFLMDVVSDINPISLDKGARTQSGPNVGANISAIKALKKEKRQTDLFTGETKGKGMTLSEYFKGKQREVVKTGDNFKFKEFKSDGRDSARAMARTIGAGSIAGYALAPLVLGEDNFVNRTVEAGASFGMHAGITAAAIRKGGGAAMFGVGYGGLAAINSVRSGNNIGPF